MDLLTTLVDKGLRPERPTREEALAVLETSDDELLDVVAAAGKVRRRWFGRRVKLNYLVNLKSGLCPEDCSYCSQRLGADTGILKYSWLKPHEAAAAAEAGVRGGAKRVCLVASGRGPSERDVARVSETIAAVKGRNAGVEVCACLGFLKDGQAERLRSAGADAYNHNLNTSEAAYGDICTTHDFSDRVDTVQHAQSAGLSSCSGLIAGMGESDADLVDVVFALRDLDADSVPVNFLIPFEGTPMENEWHLTPQRALRILAMVRFVCPDVEVRLAGGREVHLRSLQPLALHLANSLFLGDYLTSEGQAGQSDLDMIADAGFEVEQPDVTTLPEHRIAATADADDGCGGHADGGCAPCGTAAHAEADTTDSADSTSAERPGRAGHSASAREPAPQPAMAGSPALDGAAGTPREAGAPGQDARTDLVAVRRRGAGTELPPNA